jgi:phosphoenolpyruvate carboxylase
MLSFSEVYKQEVLNKFTIYNSLFLDLPLDEINHTGVVLPIFTKFCKKGFDEGKTPVEIVNSFFDGNYTDVMIADKTNMLFRFIQYVERQVVLFDAIENVAFNQLHPETEESSLFSFLMRSKNNFGVEKIKAALAELQIRLVLTAHPTQFYNGSVLGIITDIEKAIEQNNIAELSTMLQQLGRTSFMNDHKPSPYEEAQSLNWYLENVLYESIPSLITRVLDFMEIKSEDFENTDLISIGFWPGGDRDGNPFVDSKTTKQVAQLLQGTLMRCYYKDLRKLRRRLTFKGVKELHISIEKRIYQNAYGNPEEGFKSSAELHEELGKLRDMLVRDHGSLFLDLLDSFILKMKIFGFHFAGLDIRQDSRKHLQLWNEISLGQIKKWETFGPNSEAQIQYLLDQHFTVSDFESKIPESVDILESLMAMKDIQTQNGESACNRYIISNSASSSDVISVFSLARQIWKEKYPPLNIIPLFESVDTLRESAFIMEELFNTEEYRKHLKARNNKQVIMLGYSDGTKDGGYIQANYSIYTAKEMLTEVGKANGIQIVFFDGRGGPPARGGGNIYDFYASMGPNIDNRHIQLTVQGQTVSTKFGKIDTALHYLGQILRAGLRNACEDNSQYKIEGQNRKTLEELAETSYEYYSKLKNHPSFVDYLFEVTPLRFFGETNIGSRPSKRNKDGQNSFDDLRAIPFVGSWALMKQNVPGYFGIGYAINKMSEAGRIKEVENLYKSSRYFRTLLSNSMQSLSKSFFPATKYLKKSKKYAPLWLEAFEEYNRTVKWLLILTNEESSSSRSVALSDSIRRREDIVLPVITIQQYAIQRLLFDNNEISDEERDQLQKLILRCMFSIINAARNAA